MMQPPCTQYLVSLSTHEGEAQVLVTAWAGAEPECDFRILPDRPNWRPIGDVVGGAFTVTELPKAA